MVADDRFSGEQILPRSSGAQTPSSLVERMVFAQDARRPYLWWRMVFALISSGAQTPSPTSWFLPRTGNG